MKTIAKLLAIVLISMHFISCSFEPQTSSPQITMDPYKDAQTCIKLYKSDKAEGIAYSETVIATYYIQGKREECDKFSDLVAQKMAEINFQFNNKN